MKFNIKTRHTAFVACSLLACTLFSSAFGGEPVRSETVKFHDVNVGTPAGVQVLYQRIHSAALSVCSADGVRDLARAQSSATCAKAAEAGAIKQLDLPALTAYYQIKIGVRPETLAAM
jgi:UrcA family protein